MKGGFSFFFPVAFVLSAAASRGEPYAVFKVCVWIFIGLLLGRYVRPRRVFIFLAAYGVIEAMLGTWQFIFHKSLGLRFLGESVLSPLNSHVARTFVSGGRLLRAYGTFPHPNILAAFLVLSLIAWAYFFVRARGAYRVAITLPLFIICLGLVVTFSRTAWLAAVLAAFGAYFFIRKADARAAHDMLVTVVCIAVPLIVIFFWAIFPRVNIGVSDYAVTSRQAGYGGALRVIQMHPFFGSGITLSMGTDPVHSLYVSIAKEMGLVGLGIFLAWVVVLARGAFYDPSLEIHMTGVMLITLLFLGLSDHFLWTLRPGIAMLWGSIGLLAFRGNNPKHP